MKKIIIAALLLSGVTLKAQHDISTDVLGFAFSRYGINYEYALNSQNSVGINFNMTSKNMFTDNKNAFGDIKYSEMNIIPEYKSFLTPNKGNDGVYIGVYAKYRTSNSKDNLYFGVDPNDPTLFVAGKTDVSTSGFALGALGGYKWKTSGAMFIDFTVGVGKFLSDNIKYSDATAEKLSDNDFDESDFVPYIGNGLAVDLRLELKLGIRIGSAK